MKKALLLVSLFAFISIPSSVFASTFNRPMTTGATGSDVTVLQQILVQQGLLNTTPTGYFGALTAAALAKLQQAHGLEAVGSVGPQTRTLLNSLIDAPPSAPSSQGSTSTSGSTGTNTSPGGATAIGHQLGVGSAGADVTALQQFLAAQGFFSATPTGFFGLVTAQAVEAFQGAHSLDKVGNVGPRTLALINQLLSAVAEGSGGSSGSSNGNGRSNGNGGTSTSAPPPVTISNFNPGHDNSNGGGSAVDSTSGNSGSGGGGGGGGGSGTVGGTSNGTGCPLPAYPNTTCAGLPSSVSFSTTVNGDYTATAGQTINGWHITGSLTIGGANVTITNSEIDGTVTNDSVANSSFTITDSTIGPAAACSSAGLPAIDGHDFTATRVYMRNHGDAVDLSGGNVTVQDSFLQPCFLPGSIVGGDGYHSDGVQDICGSACGNLTLSHNTIDSRAPYQGQNMGNSAIYLGSVPDGSNMRSPVTIQNNLFEGGGYTAFMKWDAGANWTVTNNDWVNGVWAYGPIDGESTCSNQTWSGNALVTIDANYNVTGTVSQTSCVN